MKKVLGLILLGLFVLTPRLYGAGWMASSEYYTTDTPAITSVSNSSVAGCWYTLSGSQQRFSADTGSVETTQAYQIAILTSTGATVDFFYAYSNTPAAWFPWLETIWGPLQTKQQPKTSGIMVSVQGTSLTCSAFLERKY